MKYRSLLGCLALSFGAFFASAQPLRAIEADEVEPAEVAQWIAALDSDRFAEREQASSRLRNAGLAAVDAVAQATERGSAEVFSRSFTLLENWRGAGDPALTQAANDALERLAQGEPGRAARRAAQLLNDEEDKVAQNFDPRQLFVGGGPIVVPRQAIVPIQVPGGIQGNIQIQANGGGVQRAVQIFRQQQGNATRKISIKEPNRSIKIDEDPKNGIQIEVTETKNGKPTTTKYAAKDLDDLKKNHPDGAQLYEKYAGPMNQIQIQLQPNVLPAIPRK